MDLVRIGLIGMGNMGRFHANYLQQGKVARCRLTALCSTNASMLALYPDLKKFTASEALIRSGEVDAILIATPHYQHTSIGIDALEHGLHVMLEKPISVHKADCERLLSAHRNPKQVVSAMFQLRTEPRYRRLKKLIQNGELGEIVRTNWIVTDWFRTEAYYASGGWRATWKGEGGGVLLNQCPHNLDLFVWLCGMPVRVRGFCQLGRFHEIEVEDNVTAFLEYPNGGTGVFITSTGEAPGSNRLEIVGDRGRVVIEHGKLAFTRNEVPMREFSRASPGGFTKPEVWNVDIPCDGAAGHHVEIMQNFVDAILNGTPLIAPASEGIHSVELANAILYSSLEERTISMPLDAAAYERRLKHLIAGSTHEKQVSRPTVDDFEKSFNR